MSERKPKPTHIYREEEYGSLDYNATTQSFSEPFWHKGLQGRTARAVRDSKRDFRRQFHGDDAGVRYWIGEITWKPVFQSEEGR